MLGHVDSMLCSPIHVSAWSTDQSDAARTAIYSYYNLFVQLVKRADASSTAPSANSGDHIGKATPVPIPNTVVKLSEPMIVPKA